MTSPLVSSVRSGSSSTAPAKKHTAPTRVHRFAGAVLLLPERTEETSGEVVVPGDGGGLEQGQAAEA